MCDADLAKLITATPGTLIMIRMAEIVRHCWVGTSADVVGEPTGLLGIKGVGVDKFENWIKLVDALIWPTVALVAVYVFRGVISERFQDLRKLKSGAFELEFGAVEEVSEAARQLSAVVARAGDLAVQEVDAVFDALRDRADGEPRDSVLEAWTTMRRFVRDAAQSAGALGAVVRPSITSSHVRALVSVGMPVGFVSITTYLNRFRQGVSNERVPVDPDAAQDDVDTCRQVALAAVSVAQRMQVQEGR